MTDPSWKSLEAWRAAERAAIDAGLRPIVGTACPVCYKLLPRTQEARWDVPRRHFCGCGVEKTSRDDEYATHGVGYSREPPGLRIVE